MGYIDFETENAIYRVEFVSHNAVLNVNDLNPNADLVALELAYNVEGYTDKNRFRETNRTGIHTGIKFKESNFPNSILKLLKQKGIPLFLPDIAPIAHWNLDREIDSKLNLDERVSSMLKTSVGLSWLLTVYDYLTKKRISRRGFLTGGLSTLIFSLGLYFNKNKSKLLLASDEYKFREFLRRYDAFINRQLNNLILEARNLVIAEKLEKFVAPEMKKRLGKKPVIYLAIGAGHTNIVECLKDKEYRQKTIESFLPLEDRFHQENLYGCLELRFHDGVIEVVDYSNVISVPKPSQAVLEERKRIAEMIERRLELEKSRPENMSKRESRKEDPLSRRDFFRRLRPRA